MDAIASKGLPSSPLVTEPRKTDPPPPPGPGIDAVSAPPRPVPVTPRQPCGFGGRRRQGVQRRGSAPPVVTRADASPPHPPRPAPSLVHRYTRDGYASKPSQNSVLFQYHCSATETSATVHSSRFMVYSERSTTSQGTRFSPDAPLVAASSRLSVHCAACPGGDCVGIEGLFASRTSPVPCRSPGMDMMVIE